MNKEKFTASVAGTTSFDEFIFLVKKETKGFVKNFDLKTGSDVCEFCRDVIFTVVDVVKKGDLTWDTITNDRNLINTLFDNEIELATGARNEIAAEISSEFYQEYTISKELTHEELSNLDSNFRNILVEVASGAFLIKQRQEWFEYNKSKLVTENYDSNLSSKEKLSVKP